MGVIDCKKHGLGGFRIACTHVSDAVKNGALPSHKTATFRYRGFTDTVICCEPCATKIGSEEMISDAKYEEIMSYVSPLCGRCFDEATTSPGAHDVGA